MDKAILKQVCKYYRGEKQCPFVAAAPRRLWNIERVWATKTENATEDNEDGRFLQEMLDDYVNAGLINFEADDGVPVGLKAMLYNRHNQALEMTDPTGFKEWYRSEYMKGKGGK